MDPQPFLMEIVSHIQYRNVQMEGGKLFTGHEHPIPESFGAEGFPKPFKFKIGVQLRKDVIIRLASPKIKVRSLLCQKQVASLLDQKAFREDKGAKLFLGGRASNILESELNCIESGGQFERNTVFKVNRTGITERVKAFDLRNYISVRKDL